MYSEACNCLLSLFSGSLSVLPPHFMSIVLRNSFPFAKLTRIAYLCLLALYVCLQQGCTISTHT